MIESGERYLDNTVRQEMLAPTIDLQFLEIGSEIELVLAEDIDALRQARLKLRFVSHPTEELPGKFEVIEADLDEEIIKMNIKAGMPMPEKMGGQIYVNFACTYRPGYMPPITMGRNDSISEGRHLFMWIPSSTDDKSKSGIRYNAAVLQARVI